ncbi:septum formation protein Maf [Enterococcus saccharolyticus]|uniref:Maf family protein n=1 Tax=Enterococcus TaxID=1350 RepID=UPI001E3CD0FA|nr:Maf family protein [Enterococcus saccharolyticus]MCD5002163.1 septum formation protein Maf [Enterococcus saccharolyticus]
MTVILASQSPRRKELLRLLIEDFTILPADIDETIHETDEPTEYVSRMAQEKAAVISRQYPEDLVIASDTIVANNRILGKPTSRAHAKEMLLSMSGKTHSVYTAVVLQTATKKVQRLASAEVTFYPLTEDEIDRYLEKNEYMDKAGAYGIQGSAAVFVEKVVGDFYSIVGFPVGLVNQLLKEF